MDDKSEINYQGIPKEIMHKDFRGECIYQAEVRNIAEEDEMADFSVDDVGGTNLLAHIYLFWNCLILK